MTLLGEAGAAKFEFFNKITSQPGWRLTTGLQGTHRLVSPCGFDYSTQYFPELVYLVWYVFHEGAEPDDVIPW